MCRRYAHTPAPFSLTHESIHQRGSSAEDSRLSGQASARYGRNERSNNTPGAYDRGHLSVRSADRRWCHRVQHLLGGGEYVVCAAHGDLTRAIIKWSWMRTGSVPKRSRNNMRHHRGTCPAYSDTDSSIRLNRFEKFSLHLSVIFSFSSSVNLSATSDLSTSVSSLSGYSLPTTPFAWSIIV